MAAALIEADATMKAQAKQIEAMKEDVATHGRLIKADGSLCFRDSAKSLQVRPLDLSPGAERPLAGLSGQDHVRLSGTQGDDRRSQRRDRKGRNAMPDHAEEPVKAGQADRGCRVNRRQILAASPAVCLGAVIRGTAAAAQAETPVMRLFREWQPIADWLNGPEGDTASQPDFHRVNAVRLALEDRMIGEPAQSATDVLAKMVAYTHYGEGDVPPRIWPEARALVAA